MYLKGILVLTFLVACAWAIPLDSSKAALNGSLPLESDKLKPVDEPKKPLDKSENKTKDDKKASMEVPTVRRSVADDAKVGGKNESLNGTSATTEKPKARREADHDHKTTDDHKALNGSSFANATTTEKPKNRREAEVDKSGLMKKLNDSSSLVGKNETEPKKKISERDADKMLPPLANATLPNANATGLNKTALDEHRKEHNLRMTADRDCDDSAHVVTVQVQERSAEPASPTPAPGKNDTSSTTASPKSVSRRRRGSSEYESSKIRLGVHEKPVAVVRDSGYEAVREAPVSVIKSSGYDDVRVEPATVVRSPARVEKVKSIVREEPYEQPAVREASYEEPIAIRVPSYAATPSIFLKEASGYGDDSARLEDEIVRVNSYSDPAIVSRKLAVRANHF